MARALYDTPNGLLAAARDCGLDRKAFRQLPGSRAAQLLDRILDAFTTVGAINRDALWLWEHFREPTFSVRRYGTPSAFLALGAPETPIWLLVEDWQRRKRSSSFCIFETTLGAALRALDNYHLLEFYLVSRSLDWLVAENHHDMLIAVGEHAVGALETLAS